MTETPNPEQTPVQTPRQNASQPPAPTYPDQHMPPAAPAAPAVQQHTQTEQYPQPAHFTQPTVPLPGEQLTASAQAITAISDPTQQTPYASQQQASGYAPQAENLTQAEQLTQTPTKSRAGVFFAGIAIGAVIAGVVGGGAGALVAANSNPSSFVQPQISGKVTLNNLETATSVSGVALAATPSVVTLEVSGTNGAGSGSGVIYSADGYIVTNAHVVTLDGAAGSDPEIRVWLSDGRILDGAVVGVDPFADLAVVKVEAEDLTPIETADSSEINVGDLAVAIGAPLNLSNTVTSGVVSALNRGIAVGSSIVPDQPNEQQDEPDQNNGFPWYRFGSPNEGEQGQPAPQPRPQAAATRVTLPVIQTDASINPGNSGGALLNAKAELIGINVAIASNSSDSSTAGSDGLGFAIPVNMVTRVADALISGERPSHGLLGVGVNDSSADTDADRNVAGGLLSEVVRGGPAAEAGLKVGDVITAVDGIPADSGTSVSALIRMHAGGDTVTISYSRGGKPGETEVTLGTLEW